MHESLKKLIDAVAELMKSGFAAAEDGKLKVGDIAEFVDDLPEIVAAISIKNEIIEHLPDFAEDEVRIEAIAYFKEKFDIKDDEKEEIVEDFISELADFCFSLISLIGSAKVLFAKKATEE